MIKIFLNTVLGLVLIFIWSRFVDLEQILTTISKAKVEYLIIASLFLLASPIIRALRLKIFLLEIKKINLKDLIYLNGVALLLNFFIPIRAGEVAKGIYLNTNYQIDLKKGIIWVFIDRFVDFLVVLLLAGLFLTIIPTQLPNTFKITIMLAFLGLLLLTYLAVFQPNFTRKLAIFLRSLLIEKKIKIYFDRLTAFILDSFSILKRHPKDLFLMLTLTVLAYVVDAAVWYYTFLSLGSFQDYFKMYLGQMLSALTYLIPAAPGYVGSAEASGLLILSGVFGIESNLASAMIVLFHILSILFVLIFGLISVFSLKVDLGAILKKALKRG